MLCIFCKRTAQAGSKSHILPESLGGSDWACLPDGLVCSECNQYFGSKVESKALSSFPFLPFRILLGIPTKKRRPPSAHTTIGTLRSGPLGGTLGLDPSSPDIEEAINTGEVSQITLLAEPSEPLPVARMLVKMGLEVVGADNMEDVFESRFDSARDFARSPRRGIKWWWFMIVDHKALFDRFRRGVSAEEWSKDVELSVRNFGDFEVFRLQLLDLVLFTPLDSRVSPPDIREFPEPEYRLFDVQC